MFAGGCTSDTPQSGIHLADHLCRGPTGKGQQENSPGVYAAGDKPDDAVYERGRLPGAGPGNDQKGTVAMLGCLALLDIEPGKDFVAGGSFVHGIAVGGRWQEPSMISHFRQADKWRLERPTEAHSGHKRRASPPANSPVANNLGWRDRYLANAATICSATRAGPSLSTLSTMS